VTKEDLKQANLINEQIDVLSKFLKDTQQCWGKLSFFVAPKQQNAQVTIRTSHGWCNNEVSASERLSVGIIDAIKNELALLQAELDAL